MQSQIQIRLPFRIAIPDGRGFITVRESCIFKVLFDHKDLVIVGAQGEEEPLSVTLAVITIDNNVHYEAEHPIADSILRAFFQNSFDYLNYIIDTYRSAAPDYSVRNITLTDLPTMLEIMVDAHRYLYLVNVPHWIAGELQGRNAQDTLDRVGKALATSDSWPGLANVRRFYASARQHLEQGNHFNAVIDLETTFELQMRVTFFMMLNEMGVSETKRTTLLKTPLRNLLQQQFAKYLDADFSFTDPGPVSDWYRNLYLLRNACVHEGKYYVSGDEVIAGFHAYHSVQDFIESKLIAKGLLTEKGWIDYGKHAPRRQLEQNPELVKERLVNAGLVPEMASIVLSNELANNPEDAGQGS